MAEGNPQQAIRLNREGLTLLEDGDVEEAIETFTQAIAADPNYAPSYINRAACFRKLGREEEARQDNVLYNTLSVGGRFSGPGPQAGPPVAAPHIAEPDEPAVTPDAVPVISVEQSEQEAPTAPPPAPEPRAADAEAKSHEDEVTDAGVHPAPPRGFGLRRGQQDRAKGKGLGDAVGPDEAHPTAGELRVSARQYTTDKGGSPTGAWFLNRWGFRDGITTWTVERFFRTLFLVIAFGAVGVLIARVSFCPSGVTSSFWTGCWGETLGFGLGGALLGMLISLMVTRGLIR